jgi:hypothetical protein
MFFNLPGSNPNGTVRTTINWMPLDSKVGASPTWIFKNSTSIFYLPPILAITIISINTIYTFLNNIKIYKNQNKTMEGGLRSSPRASGRLHSRVTPLARLPELFHPPSEIKSLVRV